MCLDRCGQRTACGGQFSSSTTWVQGPDSSSQALASAFTYWAVTNPNPHPNTHTSSPTYLRNKGPAGAGPQGRRDPADRAPKGTCPHLCCLFISSRILVMTWELEQHWTQLQLLRTIKYQATASSGSISSYVDIQRKHVHIKTRTQKVHSSIVYIRQ